VRLIVPVMALDLHRALQFRPPSTEHVYSEELQQLPGFSKDYEANLKEAKRLLAEAGYPDGFKTVLTNRMVAPWPVVDASRGAVCAHP
jgi:ABC-type transport system substrate-binding protein